MTLALPGDLPAAVLPVADVRWDDLDASPERVLVLVREVADLERATATGLTPERARILNVGNVHYATDAPAGEDRLQQEPAAKGTPDQEFDRRWALTMLDGVLARLAKEYAKAGKAKVVRATKPSLGGDRDKVNYSQMARELELSEGAVRVAVHRLRQCYRELLRDEIAQTVAAPAEVEDELRQLFRALAA